MTKTPIGPGTLWPSKGPLKTQQTDHRRPVAAPRKKRPQTTRVRETTIKEEVRRMLGANPAERVAWVHVGGAIVMRAMCPKCQCVFGVHDHALGARLDAGLGTGTGDVIGLIVGGRFFQAEVKAEDGEETPEQGRRRRLINKLGGYACVVRSGDEAITHLSAAREGAAAPRLEGDPEDAPTPAPGDRHELAIERLRSTFWAAQHASAVAELRRDKPAEDKAVQRAADTLKALRAMGAEP